MYRYFSRAAKIVIIITVIAALFSMTGCDLWPFGKKDTGEEALKLKNDASRTFQEIQSHASEFDEFLKKFNKRWYTAKDVQGFASSLKTYESQISKDLSGLKQVDSKLATLTSIDKDQKYKDFISSTSKASVSLEKALFNSQKIATALNTKMGDIASFYSEVDTIKQAQSRYVAAISSWAQRRSLQLTSQTLLEQILAEQNQEEDSETETGGDESSEEDTEEDSEESSKVESPEAINEQSTNSEEVKEEKDFQSSATRDVLGQRTIQEDSTTGGSSTEDLDPWVYIIIENKWPSAFVADFAKETAEDFTNIYQRLYEIHSTLKFQNSRKLLKYIQEVKTDNADFASGTDALIDNLKEQRRLGLLIDRYKQEKASLEEAHAFANYSQQNRPAGVSSGSIANEGATFSHDFAHDEINRLDKKIDGFQKTLNDVESKYEGSLTTDYEEARWRFYWSLMALYKINRGVSRSLMHEVKGWKQKATGKYTFDRMRNLADAKHFKYKANQAYKKAKGKIAAN
ncbi:MAG: hypothetical protein E3J54_05460 [Actinobacteria bacterium]|nr:MAG: hypothetical protein E3J54_05460 [Actinomycetota bacterium]